MRRALPLLVVSMLLSGCGVLIDSIYLISNKRFTREERQSQPTGQTQYAFEHTVRVEQGQVWLACEDTERTVDRVWLVRKQYEHVNGIYQAHIATLLLDLAVGGALGIGFGIKCGETGRPEHCTPLIAVSPFAIDAIYSAVRLATVEPPKLVNKERQRLEAEPGAQPLRRATVACEPDAVIMVGRNAADPLAEWARVDAWGAMPLEDQERLVRALQRQGTGLFWAAGGREPQAASIHRCEALKALGRGCPEGGAR
jgi:hypothetical protein